MFDPTKFYALRVIATCKADKNNLWERVMKKLLLVLLALLLVVLT
jgi:hypothetical protein